jgi:hypothetical protein
LTCRQVPPLGSSCRGAAQGSPRATFRSRAPASTDRRRVRVDPLPFDLVRRQAGSRFGEIERVISRNDGYAVVEKVVAKDYMEETDPRSEGPAGT